MKTVMKKIFSLMLVAVLLVSAVPFAASAEEAANVVKVQFKVNGEKKGDVIEVTADCITVDALYENCFTGATGVAVDRSTQTINAYAYRGGNNGPVAASDTILAGEAVHINVTIAEPEPQPQPEPTPEPQPEPTPVAPIKIVVKVNSSNNVVWEGTKVPANGEYALVENLLTYCWNKSWDDVYTFSHAYRYANDGTKGEVAGDAQILAGEEVHIMVKSVPTDSDSNNSGSNNSGSNNSGSNNSGSNNGGVNDYYGNEALKDLWLYIYTNKNMTEPAKRIQISGHLIGYDGVIEKGEVLSIVDDYYKATDSSKGIIWKGMYLSSATTASSNMTFVSGQLYDTLYGVTEERYKDVTVIMARVDGVSAINSYTADSSNPKTGDMIMAPVAVLGLSASALAVLFFLNKKRAF